MIKTQKQIALEFLNNEKKEAKDSNLALGFSILSSILINPRKKFQEASASSEITNFLKYELDSGYGKDINDNNKKIIRNKIDELKIILKKQEIEKHETAISNKYSDYFPKLYLDKIDFSKFKNANGDGFKIDETNIESLKNYTDNSIKYLKSFQKEIENKFSTLIKHKYYKNTIEKVKELIVINEEISELINQQKQGQTTLDIIANYMTNKLISESNIGNYTQSVIVNVSSKWTITESLEECYNKFKLSLLSIFKKDYVQNKQQKIKQDLKSLKTELNELKKLQSDANDPSALNNRN